MASQLASERSTVQAFARGFPAFKVNTLDTLSTLPLGMREKVIKELADTDFTDQTSIQKLTD